MTKLIFATLLTLTMFSCEQGKVQVDNDKERLNSVCDKFMQTFREGNLPGAMETLKQNSIIGNSAIDTLQETIKEQLNNIFPSYGKMLSYEFISERKIKNFITRRFYILKFDKYYLKFDFTLYNNGKRWTITGFKYNEEILELLN
jgi:hypothetical protein